MTRPSNKICCLGSHSHLIEAVLAMLTAKHCWVTKCACLQIVEEIASAQATIELLLPQGDFAGALDVLGSIQATCRAHSVAGLHAFQHLPSQLIDISEVTSRPTMCMSLQSVQHDRKMNMSFSELKAFFWAWASHLKEELQQLGSCLHVQICMCRHQH